MRTWKALAAGAALLAAWPATPVADAQAPVKVKQAGFKVIDLAVPFIAKSRGSSRRTASTGSTWRSTAASWAWPRSCRERAVHGLRRGRRGALRRKVRTRSSSTAWSTRSPWTWWCRNDVLERLKITPATPLSDKLKALKGLTFGSRGPVR